jgi:hypothetical protein
MVGMDEYVWRQHVLTLVRANLNEIYERKRQIFLELAKLEMQIKKHLAFIEELENDDE